MEKVQLIITILILVDLINYVRFIQMIIRKSLYLFFILVLGHSVILCQNEVKLIIDDTVRSYKPNLKSMNTWIRSPGSLSGVDRNRDWIIEIKEGVYKDSNWHNIIWGDRVSNPNSGYTLTIRPELNSSVTIKGGADVERAFKIGSETSGLILDNIIFDGFYRVQILMYKSSNCIIKNCTFQNMNREGAWAAISIQDCQGSYNNNIVENNTFRNLDSPGIGLHAVYLTRSDNTQIKNNKVFYSSGGVFKCVDGSDENIFDGNTIYDGCGDHAYFIGRNGTGQTILSKGNIVTNTNCLESEGYKTSHTYDTSAYKYVRKFVYTKESWSFDEYEWPDNLYQMNDSSQPFYIPAGHTGNNFNQIRSDFDVNVDNLIDEDPAYIYLASNPVGDADNPLFRAKYEFNAGVSNLITFPYYHTAGPSYNKYLNYFRIDDRSKKPRSFNVKFVLRTCEGEVIEKGDLADNDGVLTLEKWIVERIDSSGWLTDIEGANQTILFSNSNNVIMTLYTNENNFLVSDTSFEYSLFEGLTYKLFVEQSSKVTLRPQKAPTGINQVSSINRGFSLYQNYPNPFNPSTTIKFTIPYDSYISLSIYDVQGEKIKDLINEKLKQGIYKIKFDASNISSGVYFYQLRTKDFIKTKKLLFIK